MQVIADEGIGRKEQQPLMIGCVLDFLDTVNLLDLALALIGKGRRILHYKLRKPSGSGFPTTLATVCGR